jgi:hypothetical protein
MQASLSARRFSPFCFRGRAARAGIALIIIAFCDAATQQMEKAK